MPYLFGCGNYLRPSKTESVACADVAPLPSRARERSTQEHQKLNYAVTIRPPRAEAQPSDCHARKVTYYHWHLTVQPCPRSMVQLGKLTGQQDSLFNTSTFDYGSATGLSQTRRQSVRQPSNKDDSCNCNLLGRMRRE